MPNGGGLRAGLGIEISSGWSCGLVDGGVSANPLFHYEAGTFRPLGIAVLGADSTVLYFESRRSLLVLNHVSVWGVLSKSTAPQNPTHVQDTRIGNWHHEGSYCTSLWEAIGGAHWT